MRTWPSTACDDPCWRGSEVHGVTLMGCTRCITKVHAAPVQPGWCHPPCEGPQETDPEGQQQQQHRQWRYTMLQTSWLPLGTKTCPDARVWGGFQWCTIASMNLGSIPNLLTAKWLQLNLLLSITPLLVPLFSCGAVFLLVCYNVILFLSLPISSYSHLYLTPSLYYHL